MNPSRRDFLHQLALLGLMSGAGLLTPRLLAQSEKKLPEPAQAFRFVFLTDFHLMKEGALRSAEGIAACLKAVEKLSPRPDFILAGGDYVHLARELDLKEAAHRFDLFLKIWHDHTSLPTHWVIGNHDTPGTANLKVSRKDPLFGKALFQDKFQRSLINSFDHKGWHFILMDDISPQPDGSYVGEFFPEELDFIKNDFAQHPSPPTLLCGHIPMISAMPMRLNLIKAMDHKIPIPTSMVCQNAYELFALFPGHNVKAILAGHLHHLEKINIDDILFINSGAVCASYWKGPQFGCAEGFAVLDLRPDGTLDFSYRKYGWKA